ncbi:UDP-N-acetylmuramoyl-tripeptide--D-alanyl-D-alanine ligase [Planctomicrobium piriforme]|uniref:UDP-N-acetylmuramoyl-tripeptide--D-alanyl-D-alanine ligase n=1 Tax=Planctomicrobium piriforme TaxID=1576369 RepID=A0A1I3TA24_9PLAN|nr:UDP-N-acetylmuramoyl-tripeptide--D-alanyl-D-alanine ligase [Planctomicrobium piriforme]SFJ67413.1 UDP-N-acetylmuramoyl-tripeptide--D-alanyl-D-alanine ligase [Planctomicrobium piriforme]
MQTILFQDLIAATGGNPVGIADLEQPITRIETDSRKIRPGDLFWALEGKRFDGHKFVKQALAAGAIAAVVDQTKSQRIQGPKIEVEETVPALWRLANWYRKQFEALVISVTGSVGKTTTRRMITSVLSARYAGMESPDNFNNQYGVPLSLLMLEPHHEFAVIELGASRVGDIEELAAVAEPEVGAITAIGPAHLDEFGTLEAIVRTKGELIEAIPPTGFVVLNGDDRLVRQMTARARCPAILVGEREHNNVRACDVTLENNYLKFRVDNSNFELTVTGRHNLNAALTAIAIGRQLEMTDAEIGYGLRNFQSVAGRSNPLQVGSWTVIDDTYNANPLSMSAACQILEDWQTKGKRILVTGDMLSLGDWTRDFHRLFGEEVARSTVKNLIAVGSQAAVVAGSARKNGMDAGCLGVCRDHDLALMLLDCWLQPGDVVLVKGSRGMRMEAIVTGLQRLAENRVSSETEHRKAA